jgi:hypothetical protein
MRKITWAVALTVALTNLSWVRGQSGFKTIKPSEITYTQIDTTRNLAAPIPVPPQKNQGFFSRMWSGMPAFLGGSKPVMPQVTPAPAMHTKS